MLRVTVSTGSRQTVLKAEGKLNGAWVVELEHCWQMLQEDSRHLVVDLSDVTFVDGPGKELIRRIWANGAELRVSGLLMTSIANEIRTGSNRAGPKNPVEAS